MKKSPKSQRAVKCAKAQSYDSIKTVSWPCPKFENSAESKEKEKKTI